MRFHRILITGGAGFVGASLAALLKREYPDVEVIAFDSLKRRGSELNLPRLRDDGVSFVHGDIRCPTDLESLPDFDLLIDCAAEPSVQAGLYGSPRYVLDTNLNGTINCLEAARLRKAYFLLLSSSRVYPVKRLNGIPWAEEPDRFRWCADDSCPGISERGISEAFPLEGFRSFYGTSKLAAELVVQEYVNGSGLKAIINRCGVLAGPWQMGKVDQGFMALWVARHHFGGSLSYLGYGGTGKQVRDVLHVRDLFRLIECQIDADCWDGRCYNVGGGIQTSISLLELTRLCQDVTGRRIPIRPVEDSHPFDLRIFVTDSRKAQVDFGWQPKRGMVDIVRDVHAWIVDNESELRHIFVT